MAARLAPRMGQHLEAALGIEPPPRHAVSHHRIAHHDARDVLLQHPAQEGCGVHQVTATHGVL
eukprot:11507870-Prorocentrum_lima.AAC.1